MKGQQDLINIFVDKVLEKHNVKPETAELKDDEKKRVRDIIENIQEDVSRFLENYEKQTTEHDVQEEQTAEASEQGDATIQKPTTKPKIFYNKDEN
ncbi:hypothetical protein [Evansella cellulosilytica]|uniref:Uncharacterized protein n=1 Tax=Evansella cellulosilytica (strain ATCC 21833 / DSM 2522 / FERM P-1141 / JCM 9156 / N-4) TaxID=649639 RepID=E6TUZ7_EVAC2|nr:hypothetical protein [Evansella cellulosilytica]ADU28580.1 hypothetical protein Bcell_0293 [Evansella cellulosilytica DSM 2522]